MALFVAPCIRAHMPETEKLALARILDGLNRLAPRNRVQPLPSGAARSDAASTAAACSPSSMSFAACAAQTRARLLYPISVTDSRGERTDPVTSKSKTFTRAHRAPGCPHHAPAAQSLAARPSRAVRLPPARTPAALLPAAARQWRRAWRRAWGPATSPVVQRARRRRLCAWSWGSPSHDERRRSGRPRSPASRKTTSRAGRCRCAG